MYTDSTSVPSMQSEAFYLARQPILGRDLRPAAFELLFRAAPGQEPAAPVADMAATAAVISHASQLGLRQIVGEQLAFVNVDNAVLMSDFVHFLPHDRVILEILETVRPTPQLLARIVELKALGFRFALDDVVGDSDLLGACLDLVDVVKIDLRGATREQVARLARALGGKRHALLAEKIETAEELRRCLDLGFDYFQGYHLARPTILSGQRICPSATVLLRLLNLIRANASSDTIADAIERHGSLRRNLLRLINLDPAGSIAGEIDTVAQALHRLGHGRLQLWLEILLAAVPACKDHAGTHGARPGIRYDLARHQRSHP